jgi:tetratricopeptide (TPR) repeat protein
MRLLFGPLYVRVNNRPDEYGPHTAFVAPLREMDARTFGGPTADIAYDPVTEPLSTLFARLPDGWQPDALVWWAPEYTPVPEGIEACPVRSVAALGDWSINYWGTAPMLGAFDLTVTDRRGVDVLTRHGVSPVAHWRMFSHDPALHVHDPGVVRDIDVFFGGTLNADVYDERARLVHRLVRLSPRHRVLIASNVRGEEYVRLLNRSRIVFNHAVRGEMNMRAHEAAACGALLFQERDNREIGDVFEDRRHCVLYDHDDLEPLLARYLEHEPERAAIADRARARIRDETASRHLERLIERLRGLDTWGPSHRPFAALPEPERRWRLGVKALLSSSPHAWAAAARTFSSITDPRYRSRVAGTLASLHATIAEHADPDARARMRARARAYSDEALRVDPTNAMHRLRAGLLALLEGEGGSAVEHLLAAANLATAPRTPLDSVPLPFGIDVMRLLLDLAATSGASAFDATARRLIMARALCRLGEVLHSMGNPAGAVKALRWSVDASPHFEENSLVLARRLAEAGESLDEAIELCRGFLRRDPFHFGAHEQLADLLVLAGRPAEGKAVLDEAIRVLRLLHVKNPEPTTAPSWSASPPPSWPDPPSARPAARRQELPADRAHAITPGRG